MRPKSSQVYYHRSFCFGELNGKSLHGRGIKKDNYTDEISIGCFENSVVTTGNYIQIFWDGNFRVGERYLKDGEKWYRGTWYMTDGSEQKYCL